MHRGKFALRGILFILPFVLQPCLVRAQEEPQPQEPSPPIDQTEPKPAARSPFPVIDPNAQDENQGQDSMRADFTPLTGMQNATLGTPGVRHSYWVPGVQYGAIAQSSPTNGSGSSGWYVQNYFLGNVSLLKTWTTSDLAVNYSGGGFVSSGDTQNSGIQSGFQNFQQLELLQQFRTTRWLFQILDAFSYLPQSAFGFGAGTNLGNAGIGGSLGVTIPGLSGGAVPNQSIYSTNGAVYSNAGVLQGTYAISPRSSVTLAGSYGILRFVEPGNVDEDSILGSVGYNYAISKKDTIGVFYMFDAFHYQAQPQAFGNHSVNVAYSRKITGRLALQIYGGPQISTFRVPIGTSSRQTGFTISTNVNYSQRNGGLTANYLHSLAGGSGVLIGSNLDQINFAGNHKLGRVWSGNVNFGYAHNGSVNGSAQSNSSTFNSWFGGAGVSRPIGHFIYLGLNYTAYISKNTFAGCTGPDCGMTNSSNAIGLSLQWHSRPFVLD